MPRSYTNMSAFNRSLLRKDYYTETAKETIARNDYYEAKADEDEKGLVAQFAGQIVGAVVGFMVGGPPGASIGWNAGAPVGRQIQKNRPGYFEAGEYLQDDIFTTGGKFNSRLDKEWSRTERQNLKDEEEAAVIGDLINIGKAGFTAFKTDWDVDFAEGGKYENWKEYGVFKPKSETGKAWTLKSRGKAMVDYYKPFDIKEFLAGNGVPTKDIPVIEAIASDAIKDEGVITNTIETVGEQILNVNNELELNDTTGISSKWLGGGENIKKIFSKISPKEMMGNIKDGVKEWFTKPADSQSVDIPTRGVDSPSYQGRREIGIDTPLYQVPEIQSMSNTSTTINNVNDKIVDSATRSYDANKKKFDFSILNPFKDRDIIDWDAFYSGNPYEGSGVDTPEMQIPENKINTNWMGDIQQGNIINEQAVSRPFENYRPFDKQWRQDQNKFSYGSAIQNTLDKLKGISSGSSAPSFTPMNTSPETLYMDMSSQIETIPEIIEAPETIQKEFKTWIGQGMANTQEGVIYDSYKIPTIDGMVDFPTSKIPTKAVGMNNLTNAINAFKRTGSQEKPEGININSWNFLMSIMFDKRYESMRSEFLTGE